MVNLSMERTYSIKDLELLSGIKAHTLRIWEQRYELLHPIRTTTNIRKYSDDDLRLLLNVSILKKKGYKISKIASFKRDEIAREAYRMLATDKSTEIQLDGLRQAMISLDETEFSRILSQLTQQYGFEEVMTRVIYPFLELIGVLWQTGTITPFSEHFVSSMIRQKIIVALDALPIPKPDKAKGFALACPENEFHEIGLLFACYMLRSYGFHTVYIGANVPAKDIALVLEESGVKNLYMSLIVQPPVADLPQYLETLRQNIPKNVTVFLSGRQLDSLNGDDLPSKTKVISRITEFKTILGVL